MLLRSLLAARVGLDWCESLELLNANLQIGWIRKAFLWRINRQGEKPVSAVHVQYRNEETSQRQIEDWPIGPYDSTGDARIANEISDSPELEDAYESTGEIYYSILDLLPKYNFPDLTPASRPPTE